MSYVPPFEQIKSALNLSSVKGKLHVSIPYEDFARLLQRILIGVAVDEQWYLKKYEDVAEAVRAGTMRSARAHFVENGYMEGRLPGPIQVDEEWYLSQYSDVAESVRRGSEASAQSHFDRDGYAEGRLPFPL